MLPLFYPDQHITSLVYIKAVNGGIFFDMVNEKTNGYKKNYYSYGAELTVDLPLLRLPFPIQAGVRTGYETRKKSVFADLLFTIGFNI